MRTSKYTKEFKDSTVQLALNSDEPVTGANPYFLFFGHLLTIY